MSSGALVVCDWCRVGAGGSVGESATERKVEAKKMPFTDKLKQMGAGLDNLVPLVSVLAPPSESRLKILSVGNLERGK